MSKPTSYTQTHGYSTIYVHAGAGYHSLQNESIHLEACAAAAAAAMRILQADGSAVDAVEMAVKILEDREITNAGFGSNLTIDGMVECDATIVDHLGRSGAVGAVSQIRNPVSLARMILEHSLQPLSLRRVPPNLLVSMGATLFAKEMGMVVSPESQLVSHGSKERWARWRQELSIAGEKTEKPSHLKSLWRSKFEPVAKEMPTHDAAEEGSARPEELDQLLENVQLQQFATSSLAALQPSQPEIPFAQSQADTPTLKALNSPASPDPMYLQSFPFDAGSSGSKRKKGRQSGKLTSLLPSSRRLNVSAASDTDGESDRSSTGGNEQHSRGPARRRQRPLGDGSSDFELEEPMIQPSFDPEILSATPNYLFSLPAGGSFSDSSDDEDDGERKDHITDTVGAVAVDNLGRIAAASSSGGIGMKHRGRMGPAALIGIGTAVIPVNQMDPQQTCVAVVTSGTGEHMATTMAANVCAERLYSSMIKRPDGKLESSSEDLAMKAFIENDFMSHPGVKHSLSIGAIGTLALKKTNEGTVLMYAHNTDSFAIASMRSGDRAPQIHMSRNSGNGDVAAGGRWISP